MAIIRVDKTKNYTVMANSHLQNKEMSLKAKGLMSIMLALPEGWDYSGKGLSKLSADGLSSVRTALTELERLKYLERKAIKVNGRFSDWEYTLYEQPVVEIPQVEKPQVEIPQVENQTQLNTNILNTNIESTNIIEETKKEIFDPTEAIGMMFETTWKQYPRKMAKGKALATYKRLFKGVKNDEQVRERGNVIYKRMVAYTNLLRQKGTEMQFIPYFSSWLNAELFEWGKK